jgi:hypothetical protein
VAVGYIDKMYSGKKKKNLHVFEFQEHVEVTHGLSSVSRTRSVISYALMCPPMMQCNKTSPPSWLTTGAVSLDEQCFRLGSPFYYFSFDQNHMD